MAVAGVMIMSSAEMLAAIQILVYLGSVMLVVQFGVMLTRRQIQEGDIQ
jgi:NADH:ubiquinone oxidoreductase subunit 6 (subunit J)